MKRTYRVLLQLYPASHRARFAAEMQSVFDAAMAESRRCGIAAFARFAVAELFGLVLGAVAEWIAEFAYAVYRRASLARPFSLSADYLAKLARAACGSGGSFGGRLAPDWRAMRPPGVTRDRFYGAQPR